MLTASIVLFDRFLRLPVAHQYQLIGLFVFVIPCLVHGILRRSAKRS